MDERPWDPPQYEPKSGMTIPRYANNWEDCGSATHGTIRRHHSWGFCPQHHLDTTEEWNIKNGMAQVIPFL